MVLRWMVGCSFVLLLWLGFHANLPVSNSTWLGPVGENYTISPAGSGRSPFQDNARRHLHNRQNRSHAPHRAGTLQGKCGLRDRKSTRLNSSHGYISYAVFCLKKKKTTLVESRRVH